jgi:hypothetical protein
MLDIENKLENVHENFTTALYNRTRYVIKPYYFIWSRPFYGTRCFKKRFTTLKAYINFSENMCSVAKHTEFYLG